MFIKLKIIVVVSGMFLLSFCSLPDASQWNAGDGWTIVRAGNIDVANNVQESGLVDSTIQLPKRLGPLAEFKNGLYRIELKKSLDPQIVFQATKSNVLGVRLGRISEVVEIFLEDEPCGIAGNIQPFQSARGEHFSTHCIMPLEWNHRGELELRIVVYARKKKDLYILGSDIQIGPAKILQNSAIVYEFLFLSLLVVCLALAFFNLLLYVLRRSEQDFLYFSLFLLSLIIYFLSTTYSPIRDYIYGQHHFVRDAVKAISEYTAIYLYFLSVCHLLRGKIGRSLFVLGIVTIVLSILRVVFLYSEFLQIIEILWLLLATVITGILFYTVQLALRARMPGSWLIFFATLVFVIAEFTDWTLVIFLHMGDMGLSRFGLIGVVLAHVIVLAQNFVRARSTVEGLLEHLDDEVQKRTIQLEATLSQIQALKIRQDCDYYLTAQLSGPLSRNHVDSDHIKVDLLVKQFKQFSYRKWDAEIGGDIAIADQIKIAGRKYTVVLNGDAMGKSLQGAGGSILLGAMFHARLASTRLDFENRANSPETWLLNTYQEIQAVFLSFEGHMLASMTILLLDEGNGYLAWINAAQPHLVILRDGRAYFIDDDELEMPQPGIRYKNVWNGCVNSTILAPGDLVLLGSDGREDLIIESSIDSRSMNDDPELFLRCAEKAGGVLEKIYQELARQGQFSDDISLVSIGYGHSPRTLEECSRYVMESKLFVNQRVHAMKAALRNSDYIRVAELMEEALEMRPHDSGLLEHAALNFVRAGNQAKAEYYLQRLRLRKDSNQIRLRRLIAIWEGSLLEKTLH